MNTVRATRSCGCQGGCGRGITLLCHLLVILTLLPALGAWADTLVYGAISTDTRWTLANAPYRVTGDVAIQNGATLSIDPDVTVYMGADTSLTVQNGSLQALGTAAAPIRVLSDKTRLGEASAPGDWNQWLIGSGAGAVRLEHMQFKDGRGLAINGSAPVLNYVDLRDQAGAAITVDLTASPSGVGLSASGCGLNGILVPAGEIRGSVTWGLRGIPYVLAAGTLSVGAAPAVTSLSPAALEQGQTAMLTINGSRLGGLSRASLDGAGLTLTSLPGSSSSLLYLLLEAAADAPIGSRHLSLQVDAGEVTASNALEITPPRPVITSLAPAIVLAGAGDSQIRVIGRHFRLSPEVLIDSQPLATQAIDEESVQFSLANQMAPGTRAIQVRYPDPRQTGAYLVSQAAPLMVTDPEPPTLAIEPAVFSLPADNASHPITLRLSRPDYRDNTLNLALSDATLAGVTGSVVIPAGQTAVQTAIIPFRPGLVTLTVTSDRIPAYSMPFYIVGEVAGTASVEALPLVVYVVNTPLQGIEQTLHAQPVGAVISQAVSGSGGNVLHAQPVGAVISQAVSGSGGNLLNAQPVGTIISQAVSGSGGNVLHAQPVGAVISQAVSGSGGNVLHAQPVGAVISRGGAGAQRMDASLDVGIDHMLTGLAPTSWPAGGSVLLAIDGYGIPGNAQLTLQPAAGIQIGAISVTADGRQLHATLDIAADAAPGPRRVQVKDGAGREIVFADPTAAAIQVLLAP